MLGWGQRGSNGHALPQHGTISMFNNHLTHAMDLPEIFHLISSAHEFANVRVREEELGELDVLKSRAHVEVMAARTRTCKHTSPLQHRFLCVAAVLCVGRCWMVWRTRRGRSMCSCRWVWVWGVVHVGGQQAFHCPCRRTFQACP